MGIVVVWIFMLLYAFINECITHKAGYRMPLIEIFSYFGIVTVTLALLAVMLPSSFSLSPVLGIKIFTTIFICTFCIISFIGLCKAFIIYTAKR